MTLAYLKRKTSEKLKFFFLNEKVLALAIIFFTGTIHSPGYASIINKNERQLTELVTSFDSLLMHITNCNNANGAYKTYINNLFANCTSNKCLIDSINRYQHFYVKALKTFELHNLKNTFFIFENNTLYSIQTSAEFYQRFLHDHDSEFFRIYFQELETEGMLTPTLIVVIKRFNEFLTYDTYDERFFVLSIFILLSYR